MNGLLPLLLVACVGGLGDGEHVGEVKLAGGTERNNGLDPETEANPCWSTLVEAMDVPVYVVNELNEKVLNDALPNSVKPGGECEAAFSYATDCASFMTSASGWLDEAGLDNLAKQEVLSCVLALVNPNEGIQVCLTSQSIEGGPLDCLYQSVDEAIWQVRLGRNGSTTRHVWPLTPSFQCTTNALQHEFAVRLCGPAFSDPSECGIVLHDDLTECSEEKSGWTCNGLPAVKSSLGALDWITQYPAPGCDPIPQ